MCSLKAAGLDDQPEDVRVDRSAAWLDEERSGSRRSGTDVDEAQVESIRQYNENAPIAYHLRSPEQIKGYFDGLELVDPGLVPIIQWRPDPNVGPQTESGEYGAVGRKP